MISLKRKVHKIVLFRLKCIFTEQKYTYNREIKLIWFELIRIKIIIILEFESERIYMQLNKLTTWVTRLIQLLSEIKDLTKIRKI